jgi:hypothetical protein
MQMDLCYDGKQEYKCYIVWREPGGVRGKRVSAGRSVFSSAVRLNSNGYYTVRYADDSAILINGKFPHTVSEVLQTALHTVQQWCKRTNLPINPNKMVIIRFTKKRNIKGLKKPILNIIFQHPVA